MGKPLVDGYMLQGLQRFTDVRWGSQVPRHATRLTEHARTSDDWENACFLTCTRVSASMFLKGTSQWPEHALVSAQILGGNCTLDRYWLVFQLARSETLEFPCLIQSIQLQDTSTIQNLRTPIQPLCICEKNPSPGSTWGYYGFFAYFVTEQKCWPCRPKLFGLSKMPQLSDLHRSCRLGQCKNTGTPIQIPFFSVLACVSFRYTWLLDFSL